MSSSPTTAAQEAVIPAFAYLDVDDPLVAWLTYRGELVSSSQAHRSALSIWTTRNLRSAAGTGGSAADAYAAELALDAFRLQNYPNEVGRLQCFYAFEDEGSARTAATRWLGGSFRPEFLAELGILTARSRTSRYDAQWITHKLSDPDEKWMHSYFRGDPCGSVPIWETLVDGRVWVLGKELRDCAGATVRKTWPESAAILEGARIGAWLGSDLGLITAMAFDAGDGIDIKYAMNTADVENAAFHKRVAAYTGPKNFTDLNVMPKRIPDLTDRFFKLR